MLNKIVDMDAQKNFQNRATANSNVRFIGQGGILPLDYLSSTITIFCLLCFLVACTSKKNDKFILSDPPSTLFDDCRTSIELELKTFSDSLDFISIDLPIHWDVEFTEGPDGQAIFAMDTALFIDQNLIHSILVKTITAKESLGTHFKNELTGLRNDSQISILEVGHFKMQELPAFWVLTSRTIHFDNFKDLFVYSQGPFQNILVINIRLSDSPYYEDYLCALFNVIRSVNVVQKNQLVTFSNL